jgi:hypothetical protein
LAFYNFNNPNFNKIIIILFISSFFFILIFWNNNFDHNHLIIINDDKQGLFPLPLQNTYGFESKSVKIDINLIDEKSKIEYNKNSKEKNSIFNFIAVGDWACTDETKDTLKNIITQDPELVLALGDLSYNGKAKCWLELIKPLSNKTKIVIGNHEAESSKLRKDYMEYFGLTEQYYSFNYQNIHFLALSTELPFDIGSKQYEFAKQDLEKYSQDPLIDWIIVFYHRQIYGSASESQHEDEFRKVYHPFFDKYKVDLALQGHFHLYERSYPITFNNNDYNKPKIEDNNPTVYNNSKGTIFITVGTGGAKGMTLSSSSSIEDFTAEVIDGKFGILNIVLQADQKTLTGTFIENGKKKKVMDEFKIIKDKM